MEHFRLMCCNQGKSILDPFPDLPDNLHALFIGDTVEAKYFRRNIRFFNCGMSMGSVQVNDATVRWGGPAAWKVYGHLHRRLGSVTAAVGSTQFNCLQTYFCDPVFQDRYRSSRVSNTGTSTRNSNLKVSIFCTICQVLSPINTYLRSFVSVMEYIDRERLNPEEIRFELHATERPLQGIHPGRLNLPTAPEISILMPVETPINSKKKHQLPHNW